MLKAKMGGNICDIPFKTSEEPAGDFCTLLLAQHGKGLPQSRSPPAGQGVNSVQGTVTLPEKNAVLISRRRNEAWRKVPLGQEAGEGDTVPRGD